MIKRKLHIEFVGQELTSYNGRVLLRRSGSRTADNGPSVDQALSPVRVKFSPWKVFGRRPEREERRQTEHEGGEENQGLFISDLLSRPPKHAFVPADR